MIARRCLFARLAAIATVVSYRGTSAKTGHPPGVSVSAGTDQAVALYSPKMAEAMATLAKLAYCGLTQGTAEAVTRSAKQPMQDIGLRLSSPQPVSHADLSNPTADFAYVARFERIRPEPSLPSSGCVVVFRGIDNAANSREIANQTLEDWPPEGAHCPGCRVSAGIRRVWEQLRPGVLHRLSERGCGHGASILVTGHSLGAGVSSLAMYSLKKDGYDVQLSYNFESPRVGNSQFTKSFNHAFGRPVALFRITHANDELPRFPASQEHSHVGNQIWYPGDDPNNYTVCSTFTEDPSCGNDGLHPDTLCPLAKSDCGDRENCIKGCGFPPSGGPHCNHPLAPVGNFCDFAGNTTTKLLDYFERSCIWGKPLLTKPLAKRVVASGGKTSTSSAPVQPTTRADDASGSSRASSTSTAKVTSTASTTNSQVAGMKEPCFKEDMRWDPLDMDVIRYPAMLMEDPSECQAWCKATRGCEHFSFYKVDGSCHITGNGSYKMPMSLGFISGPKKCGLGSGFLELKYAPGNEHQLSGHGPSPLAILAGTLSFIVFSAAVAATTLAWRRSGLTLGTAYRSVPAVVEVPSIQRLQPADK